MHKDTYYIKLFTDHSDNRIMKKLIGIIIVLALPIIVIGQVKINISDIEIANNVRDVSRDGHITIHSVGQRILLKIQWINTGSSNINLFGEGGIYYVNYFYKEKIGYTYKGRYYNVDCTTWDSDHPWNTNLNSGDTCNLLLLFNPPDFPRDNNYMSDFFEIIPSIKVIYIKGKNQEGMPDRVESAPMDWSQITIMKDVPIPNLIRRIDKSPKPKPKQLGPVLEEKVVEIII